MAKQSIAELEEILNTGAKGLPKLTSKKMFGCYALWADDNVFALVWKHGRIGVKLPEANQYESLMGVSGAEPWKAGPMQMAHWVLVPESFHAKPAEIKKWTVKAHGLCQKLEKKVKKSSTPKAAAKKPVKKKAK
ncbi:MAG: TfoX/Sxy family protein [Bdellovibrionaceae bacterium]|nr:TfoX/Sxy family protein [Pseudobdellovibrionaceae bacterium]